MDNEDVVHIYNGILLTIKRNKIGPFIETWVDEDSVLWREVIQRDVESRKIYLQGRNRDVDIENTCVDTGGEEEDGVN